MNRFALTRRLVAGIVPLVTALPLAAQVPTLTVARDLRIAADFSWIGAVAVSEAGVIAVTEAREFSLKLFSANGKQIGTAGRRGSGPGEMATISAFGSVGEKFWVYDALTTRLTWFTAGGAFERTMRMPSPAVLRRAGIPYYLPTTHGVRLGDTTIVLASRRSEPGESPFVPSLGFGGEAAILLSSDSAVVRLLAKVEASPACVVSVKNAGAVVPLCAKPLMRVRDNAEGVVVVTFGALASGGYKVQAIGRGGDTLFARQMPSPPYPIPSHVTDSLLKPLRVDARYRNQLVTPKFYAPIKQVIAGRDGSVWLEEHAPTGRRQWMVLARDGRTLGRVTVPDRVRILAAEVGTFWGVELDEDDVPSVVRYRVK